ncbi:MAG: integrase core domain-containing protein, partial [bacterium]|nr:integrase core domain-containing protein [bacterium]
MYQIAVRPRSQFDHWRALAGYWHLSPKAREKLEWMIFYQTVGKKNARTTASYFGISCKTFHKWKRRFNPHLIQSLEEKSKAPIKRRVWEVTPVQEARVKALRKQYPRYGKKKLKLYYLEKFNEAISTWKIERVIRKNNLFFDVKKHKSSIKRQRRIEPKTKINEIKDSYTGTLWHTDSIIINWYGQRRVIFTAIEDKTKLGFAHVYTGSTSKKATNFLTKLLYLSSGEIQIIHSDNGSEFAGEFEQSCKSLKIKQVYSRPRQPKDNPALERFNRTLQEEWLELSEVGLDEIEEANLDLTTWLIEYNSHRPHQALDYMTPLAYAFKQQVLPMSPAST